MPSIKRKVCPTHGIYNAKSCQQCKKQTAKTYNQHCRNKESASIYHTTKWRKTRIAVLTRDCGLCVECGHVEKRMYVDHIIELVDGGEAFDMNNLQTLCPTHHSIKTAEEKAKRAVKYRL